VVGVTVGVVLGWGGDLFCLCAVGGWWGCWVRGGVVGGGGGGGGGKGGALPPNIHCAPTSGLHTMNMCSTSPACAVLTEMKDGIKVIADTNSAGLPSTSKETKGTFAW